MRTSRSLLPASLVAIALAAAAGAAIAATVQDLYTVTVPTDPAAPDQRRAASSAAMAQLLIRVTGNRNAPLEPALQRLIGAPDEFLTSYGLDRQGRAQVGFRRTQVERTLTELG